MAMLAIRQEVIVISNMCLVYAQLETGSPLDELSIASILRELLLSLEYLHGEGKIHRDIKGASLPFLFATDK